MIIDCHGHYTTAPKSLENWRNQQIAGIKDAALMPKVADLKISDDELIETIEKNQLRLKASTDAIFKKIGLELVPVLNAFTKALLESQNANDGVRKSIDGLAKDGSIREWAEGAAKVVGFVVDAGVHLVAAPGQAIGHALVHIAVVQVVLVDQRFAAALERGFALGHGAAVKQLLAIQVVLNARHQILAKLVFNARVLACIQRHQAAQVAAYGGIAQHQAHTGAHRCTPPNRAQS